MSERLREVVLDQHGFVTAAQAVVEGVSHAELSTMVAGGRIVRAAHGAYRVSEVPDTENDQYQRAEKHDARVLTAGSARRRRAGGWGGWVAATVVSAALQRAVDTQATRLLLLKRGTMRQYRLPGLSRTTNDVDGLMVDAYIAGVYGCRERTEVDRFALARKGTSI